MMFKVFSESIEQVSISEYQHLQSYDHPTKCSPNKGFLQRFNPESDVQLILFPRISAAFWQINDPSLEKFKSRLKSEDLKSVELYTKITIEKESKDARIVNYFQESTVLDNETKTKVLQWLDKKIDTL